MASELSNNVELGAERIHLVEKAPGGSLQASQLQATSERSINDILKQETLVSSFSITPDVEVGTRLEAFVVNPNRFHPPQASSRISFMAALFQFWRGMIMLRLVFTKTILQQMKIAVLYVPGAKIDDPTPSKEEIMMYSHKQIINPSNEVEVMFEIPFVSDRPFLRMSEDTGVIYFILFQPFTASVDPTNIISCDIFASSKTLEFHEFGIIPTLDPLGFSLPNDLMFLLSETSQIDVDGAANGLLLSMTTDSGAIVNVGELDATSDISWATDGAAIGGDEYQTPIVYDPNLCKTIWGEPEPGFAGMGRTCAIKTRGVSYCNLHFHFSNRGVFIAPGSSNNQLDQFFGPMSELSRDFLQYLTIPVSYKTRIEELEKMVAHLLARPQNLDMDVELPRVGALRQVFENRVGSVIDFCDIAGLKDHQCQLCGGEFMETFSTQGHQCKDCRNFRGTGEIVHFCGGCDSIMYESQRCCGICGFGPYRAYESTWLFRKEDRWYSPVTVEFFSFDETLSAADFHTCAACGSSMTCYDCCDCQECLDNPIKTHEELVARYLGDRLSVPKPGVASLDLGFTIGEIRRIYTLMMSCGFIVKRENAFDDEPNLMVEGGWRQFRYLLEEGDTYCVPLPHHYM